LRVVLDANVFVSALIKPEGPPGQILDRIVRLAGCELVISPAIAAEILATLGRKRLRRFFRPGIAPADWFAAVANLALAASGEVRIPRLCRDPDDDKYVAAAVEAGAAYLVTGDDDLLALGAFEQVAIVRPRTFLTILERGPG
jgi:putative PIN family toxin of toxin-antitoxin system